MVTVVDQKGVAMQSGGARVEARMRPMSDEGTQEWEELSVRDCENGTYEVCA